jgi:hypothetical protein
MMSRPTRRVGFLRAIAAMFTCLVVAGWSGHRVTACDTPVYRYAMYSWTPSDYEIHFLHRGQPSAADRALLGQFDEMLQTAKVPTNITLQAWDLSDESQLTSMPSPVRAAWTNQQKKQRPDQREPRPDDSLFVVVNPHGVAIHGGNLEPEDLETLTDSPARRRMTELMHQGHGAVFILLRSGNETDDNLAESILQKAVAQTIPRQAGDATSEDSEPLFHATSPRQEPLNAAMVRISREDPQEAWLVKMLLSVEEDLHDYDEPMIFAICGRGRALEPYIGGGIIPENLADSVAFMTGNCSCIVKEQNPGLDLLTRWDWDATAVAMAERIGEEEGNEQLLTAEELFPEIVISSEGENPAESRSDGSFANSGTASDAGRDAASQADSHQSSQARSSASSSEARTGQSDESQQVALATSSANPLDGDRDIDDGASNSTRGGQTRWDAASSDQAAGPTYSDRLMRNLGIGFGAALLALIGFSLALWKRQTAA